jgi:hypothetical protein
MLTRAFSLDESGAPSRAEPALTAVERARTARLGSCRRGSLEPGMPDAAAGLIA